MTTTEEFDQRYRIVDHPVMRRIEMEVIGADYGATSYTTLSQADQLARLMGLGAGKLLLEVGSGAGWPGIYMAGRSGCRVLLTDPSVQGIRVGSQRLISDGVAGYVVAASGGLMPFRDGVVDAATSSDVLC